MIDQILKPSVIIPLTEAMLKKNRFKSACKNRRTISSKELGESNSHYTLGTVEEWELGARQNDEPYSYSDALRGEEEKECKFAVESELNSLKEIAFQSNGFLKESWMLRLKLGGTRRYLCAKIHVKRRSGLL